MTQEYYSVKEQFGILRNIAKQIDTIHEIRNTYASIDIDNMSLKDIEEFLCNRYAKIEKELSDKIK